MPKKAPLSNKKKLVTVAQEVLPLLRRRYPQVASALDWENPWELLVRHSAGSAMYGRQGKPGHAGFVRPLARSRRTGDGHSARG